MKYILIITLLFPLSESNVPYSFVSDCLDIFIKLDSATTKYEQTIRTETDRQQLNKEIKAYVNELVMYSMNRLNQHTKSEDTLIQQVAKDLSGTLSNMVRINYEYLNFVTNTESSNKELKKQGLETLNNLKQESRKFIDISTGICMTTVNPSKKTEYQLQYLQITQEQRDNLNTKMKSAFTGLENQNKAESTNFEKSTAILYHFLNLKSEFSEN
jgi:hypothetical protein